jgi:hypothetical protein
MPVESLPKDFGATDAEPLCPSLRVGGLLVADSETEHRHTAIVIRMT